MKNNIMQNFIDLESKKLKKSDGILISDKRIVHYDKNVSNGSLHRMHSYMIGGVKFFAKSPLEEEMDKLCINEIISSKMYRDLGIITPPVYPMYTHTPNTPTKELNLLTQDIFSLKNVYPEISATLLDRQFGGNTQNIWEFMSTPEVQETLLTIMTKGCYKELQNIMILSEMRTDIDFHEYNCFFYKTNPNAEKQDGVIPIDLELSEISYRIFLNENISQNPATEFINKHAYDTFSPIGTYDSRKTYSERARDLVDFIQSGKLENDQIKFIKQALDYDVEKNITDTCDKYDLDKNYDHYYDLMAGLWDYNRAVIGREL